MFRRFAGLFGVFILFHVMGFTLISPATPRAHAAAPDEQELVVGEVVVTATRLADMMQELRRVPGQVYVVTAADIQRQNARTV